MVAAAERLSGVTAGQGDPAVAVEIGSLPIPKSATPSRQSRNLDIFGFELTDDEVAAISGLAEDGRALVRGDPRTHEEDMLRAIRVERLPSCSAEASDAAVPIYLFACVR